MHACQIDTYTVNWSTCVFVWPHPIDGGHANADGSRTKRRGHFGASPLGPADAKDAKPGPCNFAAFSLFWLQLQLMEPRQMAGHGSTWSSCNCHCLNLIFSSWLKTDQIVAVYQLKHWVNFKKLPSKGRVYSLRISLVLLPTSASASPADDQHQH